MNPQRGCHSQRNYYRAHLKIWALSQTAGEQSTGRFRISRSKPNGEPLNAQRLTVEEAIQIALKQPEGGVVYCTSKGTADVYSEQLILRYREVLAQLKRRQVNNEREVT